MRMRDILQVTDCTQHTSEAAARVLAQAFADDPGMAHIVEPGPGDTRMERITSLCRYFVRYTRRIGKVVLVMEGAEVKGVSCLLSPASMPLGLITELAAGGWKLPAQLGLRSCLKAMSISAALAKGHRHTMRSQPHWYLFQMAVAPNAQRQGVGRMLLDDLRTRADRDRVPVYLETFAQANVAYYEAHGFDLIRREGMISNGSGELGFWQLVRPAFCDRPAPIASPIDCQRLYLR